MVTRDPVKLAQWRAAEKVRKRAKRAAAFEATRGEREAKAEAENARRLSAIHGAADEGLSVAQGAEKAGVSSYTFYKWAVALGIQEGAEWQKLRDASRLLGMKNAAAAPRKVRANVEGDARLENIEWLVEFGASDVEVARRVGTTLVAMEGFLLRRGRYDLVARMKTYRALAEV